MLKAALLSFVLLATQTSYAETCTFSREQVSGDDKLRFYACLRGDRVLTMGSLGTCPLIAEF